MRLKLVYIYSFVVTLLYLLTACTDGIEASSDSNGQGEGKEIPVSIMPKLVAGDKQRCNNSAQQVFLPVSQNDTRNRRWNISQRHKLPNTFSIGLICWL